MNNSGRMRGVPFSVYALWRREHSDGDGAPVDRMDLYATKEAAERELRRLASLWSEEGWKHFYWIEEKRVEY